MYIYKGGEQHVFGRVQKQIIYGVYILHPNIHAVQNFQYKRMELLLAYYSIPCTEFIPRFELFSAPGARGRFSIMSEAVLCRANILKIDSQ